MNPFAADFAFDDVANKVALTLAIGMLVGFEREWAHKEVGVRTFAVTSLLGTLACLFGESIVPTALCGVFLTVALLNAQSMVRDRSLELTTSVALMAMFLLGALIGQGHYFTGASGGIILTMLLAWKVEMARFAGRLQPDEIRGAVLLGLLSFVIYPLLPNRFVDPFNLVNPRQAWVTVVAVAGVGFFNYVLLRAYSARGLVYAALLGGLVNSTLMVVELAPLMQKRSGETDARAEQVLFLPNVAMFVRNLMLLVLFSPLAAGFALAPLGVMAGCSALVARGPTRAAEPDGPQLSLPSPVSLRRVGKTAVLFLTLAVLGTLAQRHFGSVGFLFITALGGAVSSASAAATAASLAASGEVSGEMAGMATVFASITSALSNLPLIYEELRDVRLIRRMSVLTFLVSSAGIAVLALSVWLRPLG